MGGELSFVLFSLCTAAVPSYVAQQSTHSRAAERERSYFCLLLLPSSSSSFWLEEGRWRVKCVYTQGGTTRTRPKAHNIPLHVHKHICRQGYVLCVCVCLASYSLNKPRPRAHTGEREKLNSGIVDKWPMGRL